MAIPEPRPNRRYIERTVNDLHDGDVFTLNAGDDTATWYTATGMAHSGMVVVANPDGGGTIRVSAARDQRCLVEVDYVKVAVQFTMVVDVAAWAHEYGLDREDVATDVRTYFAPDEVRRNFIPEHLRGFVKIKGASDSHA